MSIIFKSVILAISLQSSSVGARFTSTVSATTGLKPCRDTAGVRVTCGSHCWPNCPSHSGEIHSAAMDYNHYIVIPEESSCYIDWADYGRFDLFKSIDSVV